MHTYVYFFYGRNDADNNYFYADVWLEATGMLLLALAITIIILTFKKGFRYARGKKGNK